MIADALATHAQHALRDARLAERGLRDELTEMSHLRTQAQSWTEQAHLGLDARWTEYLDQRRIILNAELAQNLAMQDPLARTAAQAVGRLSAFADLETEARHTETTIRRKKSELDLMEFAVHKKRKSS